MAATPPSRPGAVDDLVPEPDHPGAVSEGDPFDALLLLALVCGAGLIALVAVLVGMNGNSSEVLVAQTTSGPMGPVVTSAPQDATAPADAPAADDAGEVAAALPADVRPGDQVRVVKGTTTGGASRSAAPRGGPALAAGRLPAQSLSATSAGPGPLLVVAPLTTGTPTTEPPPPTTEPPPPTTEPPPPTTEPPPPTTEPPPPTTEPPPPLP